MKKIRLVLVALSALYVLLTIIFLIKDESLFNSFNLLKLIDYLQAWIIVGLVLLIGVIVAGTLYIQQLKKQYRHLEKDYNGVKARLYDIEEERKAEIVRLRSDEDETEKKLEAFNQSLKEKRGDSRQEMPGSEGGRRETGDRGAGTWKADTDSRGFNKPDGGSQASDGDHKA